MTAAMQTTQEVGTLPARTLGQEREDKALEILQSRGRDLADLTDAEFEAGLARVETIQKRIHRLLDTVLVDGAHYGNPEVGSGRKAFKKPILYQAGAQEIRRLMRLTVVRTRDDEIAAAPDYCAATVTLAIQDQSGRLLVERKGTCTSLEKRFKRTDGKGWIYDDAREVLHVVIAMAEKRAASLCTLEASGATAFLANGEEMAEAMVEDVPITPWTPEEKRAVYAAAQKKGIGKTGFAKLTMDTLGRAAIGTGPDVEQLLKAIAEYQPPPKDEKAPPPVDEPGANDPD